MPLRPPAHIDGAALLAARRPPRHDSAATGHICAHTRWPSQIPPGCVASGTLMLGDTPAQSAGARLAGLASSIRFPRVPPAEQAIRGRVRQIFFRCLTTLV